jgi:hypothetical protein
MLTVFTYVQVSNDKVVSISFESFDDAKKYYEKQLMNFLRCQNVRSITKKNDFTYRIELDSLNVVRIGLTESKVISEHNDYPTF